MTLPFLAIGWQQLLILAIVASIFLIPLIALIDVLRKEFKGNDKVIWVIVILFFNIPGSLIYFLIGRNKAI